MDISKIKKDLAAFVSIPSVSADPASHDHMLRVVAFLKQKLRRLSFNVELLGDPQGAPIILAHRIVDNGQKTIGIYGHYDVQPADPIKEWESDPFTLYRRNGKLYGRGVADNKGHIIQNMSAIEMLIESGKLTNNIVFLIEGEEETGSTHMEAELRNKKEELRNVDVWYITDSGMFSKGVPQIEYALRGLVYFELNVTTGERDLHSGLYGNLAINPANVLADLFARMKDLKTGRILIDGFYDDVQTVQATELKLLEKIALGEDDLKKEMDAYAVTTVKGTPAYLAPKIEPSFDIHGVVSGFTGDGPKTVIPHAARAKFSCRLVEHQNPDRIEKLIRTFVSANLPKGVKYELKTYAKDHPFYTSLDNEYIKKTADIFSAHFGNPTVFNRSGGSIPVAEMIQRILGKPVVITGFTLPDDNIHAPNENFDETMYWEGIEALKKVYSQ